MTNKDVFAAFAQNKDAYANNVRSRVSGDVRVLFSYSTPIAYLRADQRIAYFDDRSYSVTTSKQRSQCMGVCAHEFVKAERVDHKDFRQRLTDHGVYLVGAI